MKPTDHTETERLLATYGADPARWPANTRAAADACDPVELAAQARLDAWLATSLPPAPPAALRRAILAATCPARPRMRDALLAFWQDIGGARIAAPAFALALAAGIGLGSGLGNGFAPEIASFDEAGDDLLTLALIEDDYLALVP